MMDLPDSCPICGQTNFVVITDGDGDQTVRCCTPGCAGVDGVPDAPDAPDGPDGDGGDA